MTDEAAAKCVASSSARGEGARRGRRGRPCRRARRARGVCSFALRRGQGLRCDRPSIGGSCGKQNKKAKSPKAKGKSKAKAASKDAAEAKAKAEAASTSLAKAKPVKAADFKSHPMPKLEKIPPIFLGSCTIYTDVGRRLWRAVEASNRRCDVKFPWKCGAVTKENWHRCVQWCHDNST